MLLQGRTVFAEQCRVNHMKLMAQHLRENGIAQEQILEMNFESMSFPDMDVRWNRYHSA